MTVSRFLKACRNGPREPSEHPALPVTPAAIAADAAAAVAAGADAVHIHAKDSAGHDTLEPDVVAAVLEAVRAAVPGVPVGLTTGAWAAPGPAERIALVRAWTARPDFASVNWHEPGSADLAETLLGAGVGVEPGLWNPGAVSAWVAVRAGLQARIGLEDVLVLPDGSPARGNAELVTAARALAV